MKIADEKFGLLSQNHNYYIVTKNVKTRSSSARIPVNKRCRQVFCDNVKRNQNITTFHRGQIHAGELVINFE